jgi:hypothetical protein
MENVGVLLGGLAILIIPAIAFGISTLTEGGREAYARRIEEGKDLPVAWGFLPLAPPTGPFTRWAYTNPWPAAAVFALIEFAVAFFLFIVLLDAVGVLRLLYYALEGFLLWGFIFREHGKHYR